MSVPKSMRNGKLEVFNKIDDVVSYTMRAVSMEKNFPKRYRWCVTSKIVDSCLEIKINAEKANSIRVESESDWIIRKNFEKICLSNTYALSSLIKIAYDTFGINSHTVDVWSGKISIAQQYIRKWYDADRKRYGNGDIKENDCNAANRSNGNNEYNVNTDGSYNNNNSNNNNGVVPDCE